MVKVQKTTAMRVFYTVELDSAALEAIRWMLYNHLRYFDAPDNPLTELYEKLNEIWPDTNLDALSSTIVPYDEFFTETGADRRYLREEAEKKAAANEQIYHIPHVVIPDVPVSSEEDGC